MESLPRPGAVNAPPHGNSPRQTGHTAQHSLITEIFRRPTGRARRRTPPRFANDRRRSGRGGSPHRPWPGPRPPERAADWARCCRARAVGCRLSAISRFDSPRATSEKTSSSRLLSWSKPTGWAGLVLAAANSSISQPRVPLRLVHVQRQDRHVRRQGDRRYRGLPGRHRHHHRPRLERHQVRGHRHLPLLAGATGATRAGPVRPRGARTGGHADQPSCRSDTRPIAGVPALVCAALLAGAMPGRVAVAGR